MKQEFIHKVNMDNILLGPSISKHDKPKKLMVMLHGYGDNAANFIHLAAVSYKHLTLPTKRIV